MDAWRIVKRRHADHAFSGEGARLYGGRWNSVGTGVIYCSQSLSLAALEILVHLPPDTPAIFNTYRIQFDESLVEFVDRTTLPEDWRAEPPGHAVQQVGDRWVQSGSSAILAVPSTIIPSETNYLLNPAHPDFVRVQVGPARSFSFDQ